MDRELRIRLRCLITALALAGGSGLALAQAEPSQTTGAQTGAQTGTASGNTTGNATGTAATGQNATTGLDHADRSFLQRAARSNLAQIETGQLAAQQSSDPQVKQFGERMVQDHSQANDKLKTVAESVGVQLPTQAGHTDMQEMSKLKSLSGQQFDKTYARAMVRDHRKDVQEFEHVAQTAKNPEVRAYAEQTLPTLKEHLALAEQLPGNSGSTAGATSR
jgi:putative membrane protein